MAALALGLLIAGPQPTACADNGDAGAASAGQQRGRGHADADAANGTAAPDVPTEGRAAQIRRGSHAGRADATNSPEPARDASPARGLAMPQPEPAAPAVAEPKPSSPGIDRTPAATPAAAASPSAAPAPAPVPEPAHMPAVAVAPAAAVRAPSATVGAVRTALVNLVDSSLNWLNGLPGGPVAELISGALMLVRRNLEEAVASAAPRAAVVTTSQITVPKVNNTFVVSTLADSGAGSLRQAIIDANAAAGVDEITFSVAGTIRVGPTALPTITDGAVIDGTTAPGFIAAPVVRVDFQNTDGLNLAAGAADSQILSLSLVDAAGAGVTIGTSGTVLAGDYIGVREDGKTVEANRGDGVLLTAGASNNLIGVGSDYVFVLSNVISGNRGNGITISGGTGNIVEANYIGTDATGKKRKANGGSGIQLTAGAADNLIGGERTGGNDPTNDTFATPPQGNLISGNQADGVLIDDGATGNQLSGNFIGTTASGNAALGNGADGVAIVDADYNKLIGTTSLQSPFVFYNVIAGNRGNGLVVHNADHTVVHANFFGMGADNNTVVANGGDGMLVKGDSTNVDSGGEIPLGNVMSGNRRFGIEIADTAGGVVSFNNFVGQAAFGTTAKPNRSGGILVTSSNPGFDLSNPYTWNKIRTSLIGGNWGDGIAFLGNAHGAEVTDTSVGTDNTIKQALPNLGNGIVIGGNASKIAIGGFQPSVEEVDGGFSVYSGANWGFGIVIRGNAHDNSVFNTRVGLGTGVTIGTAAKIPNQLGGILVGWGPTNTTIGGLRDALVPGFRYGNQVVGNNGNGILAVNTAALQILGNDISGNQGSGVVVNSVRQPVIGAPGAGNTIDENRAYGIFALSGLDSGKVQSSTIGGNGLTGVRMAWARGLNVGGSVAPLPNVITNNLGWGILASGFSAGSELSGNETTDNARGQVNTTFAIGLTTV